MDWWAAVRPWLLCAVCSTEKCWSSSASFEIEAPFILAVAVADREGTYCKLSFFPFLRVVMCVTMVRIEKRAGVCPPVESRGRCQQMLFSVVFLSPCWDMAFSEPRACTLLAGLAGWPVVHSTELQACMATPSCLQGAGNPRLGLPSTHAHVLSHLSPFTVTFFKRYEHSLVWAL